MKQTPSEILKRYWGYGRFRPLQEEVIRAVLSGRNVLAVLPTGAGKSVCYQVPALALEGMCLVISPLIALMQDQVAQLQQKGIAAACIHSALTMGTVNDVLDKAVSGEISMLYVAPERLTSERFLALLPDMDVRLIAVDEAHCIAQWGHDFRPDYLKIAEIKPFIPARIPWIALTATATPKVQQEILHYLKLSDAQLFRQSIYRSNLSYRVVATESKALEILALFRAKKQSSILYCPTRRKTMEARHWLHSNGIKALAYHAGLSKEERYAIQKQWTQSSDTVICATSAFGMGIDKRDVAQVVHLSPPSSLEAYYQEAGRAGRGGEAAQCVLLYNDSDRRHLEQLPTIQYPPKRFVLSVYQYLCDYLQLPVGSGAGQPFAFDVFSFVKNFKLELLPTIRAIRILEQSGIWNWEEEVLLPATLQVVAKDSEMSTLAALKPALHRILTAVLRLHTGLFSFPVTLKIWEVAKYLEVEQSVVHKGLQYLHTMGLIRYYSQQNGSFLFFHEDRCRKGDLTLDVRRIKRLKKALLLRTREVLRYLEEEETCRSVLLARYFGERVIEPCGRCDNCGSF